MPGKMDSMMQVAPPQREGDIARLIVDGSHRLTRKSLMLR